MPPLTVETDRRIVLLFPPEQWEIVRSLLVEECGNNLPFCENSTDLAMDRCRFAVLKLSNGNLDKLRSALLLAKQDWRDLLVAAGFAERLEAHRSWLPARAPQG